jgi:hypothetical protein
MNDVQALRRGKTHIEPNYTIATVRTDDTMLWIVLEDERVVGSPLAWFPRLEDATPEQRAHWELLPAKTGIYWPDVDEYISVRVLMGHPS